MLVLTNIFEGLNDYSGLFALLAALAATIVPIRVYKKEKRDKRQEMRDEYEAMNEMSRFSMTPEERAHYTKRSKLEKGLRRK